MAPRIFESRDCSRSSHST